MLYINMLSIYFISFFLFYSYYKLNDHFISLSNFSLIIASSLFLFLLNMNTIYYLLFYRYNFIFIFNLIYYKQLKSFLFIYLFYHLSFHFLFSSFLILIIFIFILSLLIFLNITLFNLNNYLFISMFQPNSLKDQMLKSYIDQIFDKYDNDKSGTLD